MRLLITGVAGFIGFHLAKLRLMQGDTVIGIDNLNDYYDVNLKKARLEQLKQWEFFKFYEADIVDNTALTAIFKQHSPQLVVNLAGQAGVRFSLEQPQKYVQSNLVGFGNILECCRHFEVEHLVFASTSSVYGANTCLPYKEDQESNHPLTIYAATKKANELMAHSYAHLYQLPATGLRFFTVYGPWGRPDMAFFSFTRDILAGTAIKVFNHGIMQRDFTFIDDIVAGISLAIDQPATPNKKWDSDFPDPASSLAPYRIYNIGCGKPVTLLDYIEAIEQALGKKAIKIFLPLQSGDVISTHADTERLHRDIGYRPTVAYQEGIRKFVDWYLSYYQKADSKLALS